MRLGLAAALILIMALFAATCRRTDAPQPTPTPPVLPTATPRSSAIGILEVDTVIAAVIAGDLDALQSFAEFHPVACEPIGVGVGAEAYCRDNEAAATLVEVIPATGCEGGSLRADEFGAIRLGERVTLYAVYGDGEKYVAVFSRAAGQSKGQRLGMAAEIAGGRLIALRFGCATTSEDFVARVPPEQFVLPPP
jgi:hypothetical protein